MERENGYSICNLKLPNHLDIKADLVSEGDEITAEIGFLEWEMAGVFGGIINKVSPNLPLVITAESYGTALRETQYMRSYDDPTWKELAEDAIEEAGLVPIIADHPVNIRPPGAFRVDHTPAQILNICADATRWTWYDIPGKNEVYFGPFDQEPAGQGRRFILTVGENIYDDNASLDYTKSRQVKGVDVTLYDTEAKTAAAHGSHREEGFEEGDYVVNINEGANSPTQEQAEEMAYVEYVKLLQSGLTGSFTMVGNPFIQPGSRVAIINPKIDDTPRHATITTVNHFMGMGVYECRNVNIAGGVEGG